MKKNFFGLLALILAIGLSAFTQSQHKKQTPLVWFDVVGGVTATTGGILSETPPTGCDESTEDLCARGFDVADCTEESQGGITTYSLNINVDPDTEWISEGYRE